MTQRLEQIQCIPFGTYTATVDPANIVNTSSPFVNAEPVNNPVSPAPTSYKNDFYRGVLLIVYVKVGASGFFTPKIYGKDAFGNDVVLAAMSSNIINGPGTYTFLLYPSAVAVTTGSNQAANGVLTPSWRPVLVASGTTNYQLSVSAVYVK